MKGLLNTNAHIVSGVCCGDELGLLKEMGLDAIEEHKEAGVLLFTGGSDVSPWVYDEEALRYTVSDHERDDYEHDLFQESSNFQVKVGICRGAQFLCAASGGKLWQDVNNHAIGEVGHPMVITKPSVAKALNKDRFTVNSYHHQMLRVLPPRWELIALASESTKKISEKSVAKDLVDIEVAWSIPDRIFTFQPHPEFYKGETRDVFLSLWELFVAELK